MVEQQWASDWHRSLASLRGMDPRESWIACAPLLTVEPQSPSPTLQAPTSELKVAE